MGLVTREFTYSAGAVIIASQHNTNENTLYNLVNGNLDNANISSSANIADTKLASITSSGKVNVSSLVISSQAQGDILYASSGSAFARLGAGTSGQILKTNGAAANPAWATYSTLFLTPTEYTDVSVDDTSDRTTTSSTYGDVTGETSTFTVGKAGLVFASYTARCDSSSGIGYVALLVDATVVAEGSIVSGVSGSGISLSWQGVLTAASHTIKIQQKNTDNSSTQTLKNSVVTARLRISHPT